MQRAADEGYFARKVEGGIVWYRRKVGTPKKKGYRDMSYREKQQHPATEGCTGFAFRDPVWQRQHPAMFEFVCERPDGAPPGYQLASLTIFVEDSLVKLCLNDRETGLVCFASGTTLQEAMGNLEASLVDGSADWRQAKTKTRKKP